MPGAPFVNPAPMNALSLRRTRTPVNHCDFTPKGEPQKLLTFSRNLADTAFPHDPRSLISLACQPPGVACSSATTLSIVSVKTLSEPSASSLNSTLTPDWLPAATYWIMGLLPSLTTMTRLP